MLQKSNLLTKLIAVLTQHPVGSGLTVVILVAAIQFLLDIPVNILLKFLGITNPPSNLVTLLSLVFASFIIIFLYVLIDIYKNQKILNPYETGIANIYPNFDAARKEIKSLLLNENKSIGEIDILIHSASNIINGNGSIIGEYLEDIAKRSISKQPRKIRILCSSISSPYYTDREYLKERASKRKEDNNNAPKWSEDEYIDRLINNFKNSTEGIYNFISKLKNYGLINIEVREHNEPYLWNLIIIDNKIFVQGDIYKNSLRGASVMVFEHKNNANNLNKNYSYTFQKYFEDIWQRKSEIHSIK